MILLGRPLKIKYLQISNVGRLHSYKQTNKTSWKQVLVLNEITQATVSLFQISVYQLGISLNKLKIAPYYDVQ